jgi:hypothetical protein
MQRRFRPVAASAVVAALIACGSGGVRPSYKPFPRAVVDTVKAGPSAILQEISARATGENLQVQWSSPAEGYFESQSYNVVTRRSGNVSNADLENYIVVRFWADSISGSASKVTGEATSIRSADPSVFGRDREQVVPMGHPGDVMVRRILQGLHERFGK